jgi:purine nucleosidase/pyrimidine-specific ribonucleoside hydrolase
MSQTPIDGTLEMYQSDPQKHSVLIDTDIGDDIDDALALALALRSPEIELRGVTTVFGDTQLRARLAAHLLHVFGRGDVPVAAGLRTPLQPRHRPSGVPQAAILDDCTGLPSLVSTPGPELIAQVAMAHHGRLTLLCLGPLTNVAAALSIEPRLFMAIGSIVMMGGSSGLPFPEWNVRSDAKAARTVLAAGIPVTMLGWNVTTRCQLREEDIERLQNDGSPQADLLSRLLAVWQRHRPRWHPRLPYLHDPLAVLALYSPELLQFEEMTARVLVHGPFQGYMIPRVLDGPLVHAAVGVDAEEARTRMMQRLLTPSCLQIT